METDKNTSLRDELDSLPGTVPEFGAAAAPGDTDDRPLWEIDSRFIDPFAPLPEVLTWAKIGDRPAIPRKGVVTLSSKAKRGKSRAIYAMLIPILTGKKLDTLTPTDERPNRVIVFDLEMDMNSLLSRYKPLTGQLGDSFTKLAIVQLKTVPTNKRRNMIEEITEQYKPDIVVIDQVAKLGTDYNSSVEAQEIGDWINAFSEERTVLTVIHQNKGADNSQMKGHLGTLMEENAVENYTVERNKSIYTMKPTSSRDTYVDEKSAAFTFTLNDEGEIVSAATLQAALQAKERDDWRDSLKPIFGDSETLTHSELVRRIMDKLGLSEKSARNCIDNARKLHAIAKTGESKRDPYRLTALDDDFATMVINDLDMGEDTENDDEL